MPAFLIVRFPVRMICAAALALCAVRAASSQSRQVPAPPQSQPIVIRGAAIHPVATPSIERGYIVFDHGVITAIGPGEAPELAPLPPNALIIDGAGLHVYPGLIAASTYLGLTEIGDIAQTNDHSELGRIKPEVRAASALNPDSDLIPVTRANGVLLAMTFPRGGIIAGRASAIRLDGWTWEDMAVLPDAGLVINWPRTEPISAWWMDRSEEQQRKEIKEDLDAIERVFDDAAAYIAAKDGDPRLASDLRYEAMRAALSGATPVFINAALASQIESAVAFALRRGLRAVIVGGDQADRVAPLLADHDVPVIVTGIHQLPNRRHDAYDRAFTLPQRLRDAGVRYCIASGEEAAHERNLNYVAAHAAAYGLGLDLALRAVTLDAANIIGLGHRYGSLEIGKSATLILTADVNPGLASPHPGHPLEITTDVVAAFIDGRRIDLGSRHKALHQKYSEKYRQLQAQP